MAMALKFRFPAPIAATTALRSAQIVRPNDLFSTFVPVTTEPSSQRMAAPTRNFEYGE